MWARGIIGLALCVLGGVSIFQGIGVMHGSSMTGHSRTTRARGGSPRARAQLAGLGREDPASAREEPQLMAPDEGAPPGLLTRALR